MKIGDRVEVYMFSDSSDSPEPGEIVATLAGRFVARMHPAASFGWESEPSESFHEPGRLFWYVDATNARVLPS